MWFISVMFRLPLRIFEESLLIINRTLLEMGRTAGQTGPSAMPATLSNNAADMVGGPSLSPTKEVIRMDDQDLGGDDLKYVSYAILFTKPDYETTLEKQKEELVNYSTNGGSFGGLKIAKFFKRLMQKGVPRPTEWDWDKGYVPGDKDDKIWTIPEEDEKFVTFDYRVVHRLPKQEADRDKDKVKVLKEIRDRLGADKKTLEDISKKIG